MNTTEVRGAWWRCMIVWLVTTTGVLAVLAWLRPELGRLTRGFSATGPVPFETVLVGVAAVAAACCAVWVWVVTTVTAAEAATGRVRHRVRGCPEAWRRLVLSACGVALASGLLVPAHAAETAGNDRRDPIATLVRGLPLPDRPTSGHPAPASRHRPAPGPEGVLVVRPGDTLWSLAAGRLPLGATHGEVEAAWRRLYAANRAVVGADPNLIRPGQRLRVPQAGAPR